MTHHVAVVAVINPLFCISLQITGDLRIISNKKLRKLISKGPNFREQNRDLCRKLCFEGIDAYRKQWAAREKVALTTLNE